MTLRTAPLGFALAALIGAIGAHCLSAQSRWSVFEETTIAGRISGSIARGHIFRTASGNVYELTDHVYLYKYAFSPSVVVLRNGDLYRLIIEGFDDPLNCRRIAGRDAKGESDTTQMSQFIESVIVSDFDGLDLGNIYKLANGQIWEQTEAWVWVWVWVMPNVQIWHSGGVWRMKVEGIHHATVVRRLR
jgi:hypothetical protein